MQLDQTLTFQAGVPQAITISVRRGDVAKLEITKGFDDGNTRLVVYRTDLDNLIDALRAARDLAL